MEKSQIASSKSPPFASMPSSREITILLLGETGVGKSTWINGFANFLEFSDLDTAEKNPTRCIVPTSFTVSDENYEEKLITVGQDANENMETGQSATQHPQSYLFPKDGYHVRLIDTPGIGDVRGIDQDKKNFELILDHISHLDSLHAICILLKPNNARLNIMFQFCIKELLTHLHKDACSNILFCFTNSRSTFYRPGDTLPALRKLLQENEHVTIPLNMSTIYCMDNEAIRFLYSLKNGIKFTVEERKNYIASWEKSVTEIDRLLSKAGESVPHSIQSTLSLNTARHTILALGSPMAEVTRNIQINIAKQEESIQEYQTSEKSKDELAQNLQIIEYEIKMKQLPEPRTVCTAVKCVDFVEVGGMKETNYRSHCHQNCGTGKEKHFKIINMVGHKKLKRCSAFNSSGYCKKCGCNWKMHMKIIYETELIERIITDVDKRLELQRQETSIKKLEKHIDNLGQIIEELKQEQEQITLAGVEFAKFLRWNAITPYNNAMEAYISHFIHDEQNKVGAGGNPKILEGLTQMRNDYRKQMATLEKAMQDKDRTPPLTPEELDKLVKRLYRMKHNGGKLREMMNTSQDAAQSCFTEKLVERNSSFTTIRKHPKKRENLWNEMKGLFNKPKSIKRKEEKSLEGHGDAVKNSGAGKPPLPPPRDYVVTPIKNRQDVDKDEHESAIIDTSITQKAPPAPPPPPPPQPTAVILDLPEITPDRASLLQDIRKKPKLRKTSPIKSRGSESDSISSPTSLGPDLVDVLKRALEIRAAKVQDSIEDDEWD